MNDGTNATTSEQGEPLTKEKIEELQEKLKVPRYDGPLPSAIGVGHFKIMCNKFMPEGIMMCGEETYRRILGDMNYEEESSKHEGEEDGC